MPKLFVVSDVHSYYGPMMKALNKAGFDPANEDHWLIVCGDAFDRGPDSCKMYDFLMGLERKVLVKGNHDILMQDMLARGYAGNHDRSNGTERTFWQLLNKEAVDDTKNPYRAVSELLQPFWAQEVNYFETQNYIFVHSWIPTYKKSMPHPADKWIPLTTNEYRETWREADDIEWEDAMWGNPFKLWCEGLNQTGKTIVFGHWHCSTGHSILSIIKSESNDTEHAISEFEDDAIWEPFIHDNIIGIDRCTAYTGEVNVLVLEDDFIA